MGLKDFAAIAEIITSVATVLILGTSATVAVMLYKWHRDTAKISNNRLLNENLRHYNELMISNEQLQDLDIKRHRWGNLEKDELIMMYQYFIYLNLTQSAFKARKALDNEVFESQLNNAANLTYKDREFINQHVFPRGYSGGFQSELKKRWEKIYKDGTLSSV